MAKSDSLLFFDLLPSIVSSLPPLVLLLCRIGTKIRVRAISHFGGKHCLGRVSVPRKFGAKKPRSTVVQLGKVSGHEGFQVSLKYRLSKVEKMDTLKEIRAFPSNMKVMLQFHCSVCT